VGIASTDLAVGCKMPQTRPSSQNSPDTNAAKSPFGSLTCEWRYDTKLIKSILTASPFPRSRYSKLRPTEKFQTATAQPGPKQAS
jgi:hypothetical protein